MKNTRFSLKIHFFATENGQKSDRLKKETGGSCAEARCLARRGFRKPAAGPATRAAFSHGRRGGFRAPRSPAGPPASCPKRGKRWLHSRFLVRKTHTSTTF